VEDALSVQDGVVHHRDGDSQLSWGG